MVIHVVLSVVQLSERESLPVFDDGGFVSDHVCARQVVDNERVVVLVVNEPLEPEPILIFHVSLFLTHFHAFLVLHHPHLHSSHTVEIVTL